METMSLYYAKKSRLNVISHLRQLSVFCVAFGEQFLPAGRYTLLGFIELMSIFNIYVYGLLARVILIIFGTFFGKGRKNR